MCFLLLPACVPSPLCTLCSAPTAHLSPSLLLLALLVEHLLHLGGDHHLQHGLLGLGHQEAAHGALDRDDLPHNAGEGALLLEAAESMRLTARGYHRVMRVARTLADMDAVQTGDTDGTGGSVTRIHIAEALSYRRLMPGREQVRMRA